MRNLFESFGPKFFEEPDLKLVDRNVPVGMGFIDDLAVDGDLRPVIIEYKVTGDHAADALVQALSYAHQLYNEQEIFAKFIKSKIRVKEEDLDFDNIRIFIVAPDFPEHVKNAARVVEPFVKLVKYLYCGKENEEIMITEIIYDSLNERQRSSAKDYSIDYHFQNRYAAMRPVFDKLAERVKAMLDVQPYARKQFLAFKRNYIFVLVHPYTDRMEIGLHLEGEEPPNPPFMKALGGRWGSRITHFTKLSKPEDVTEELMTWIRKSYELS